jgi:DNA-binding NarL/FixJ family response regulator
LWQWQYRYWIATVLAVLRLGCRTPDNDLQVNEVRHMKNILIVDDSVIMRRALRKVLDDHSEWQVCGEAENGREGVDKALQLVPDLIVLDLAMPVMNGFQAAQELHDRLPKVPILMFTTFNNSQIEREARALGVSAVKSKSEGLDTLYRSIQDLFHAA